MVSRSATELSRASGRRSMTYWDFAIAAALIVFVSAAILLLPPLYMAPVTKWLAVIPLGLGFAGGLYAGRRRPVTGAALVGTTWIWGTVGWAGHGWHGGTLAVYLLHIAAVAILVGLTVTHARAKRLGAIAPGVALPIFWLGGNWLGYGGLWLPILTAFALIAVLAEFLVAIVGSRRPATTSAEPPAPVLLGHTAEGTPIYGGGSVSAQRTNSFAVTALVLGLVVGPLAIPFGHVALSQVRKTGENGKGMAIAGLVLGYIGLVAWIALIVMVVIAFATI